MTMLLENWLFVAYSLEHTSKISYFREFSLYDFDIFLMLISVYCFCLFPVPDIFMLNILTEQLGFFLLLGMVLNIAAASASLYEV